MKIALPLAVLCLALSASGQQYQEFAGEIHGAVIDADGQPAQGIRLYAVVQCPSACGLSMRDTVTDRAGEYRFQHLHVGKYSVFTHNAGAGYPRLDTPPAEVVELTVDHPDAELRVDLPPTAGILMIHLTDRTTGGFIPRGLVRIRVADEPDSRWSEVWADSSYCFFFPDCAIPVLPDKQLLVHVSSTGFREWDQSAGKGKPLLVHSGARLSLDIELEPLPH
jgi:hypothetical protein